MAQSQDAGTRFAGGGLQTVAWHTIPKYLGNPEPVAQKATNSKQGHSFPVLRVLLEEGQQRRKTSYEQSYNDQPETITNYLSTTCAVTFIY